MTASPTETPRVLAIMGSGETAPTMARVHRQLFSMLGRPPIPAVLLDTPYGFQENADEITDRALEFFRDNVGQPMTLAAFRSVDIEPLARAQAVASAREARYLFAGPGSPSYALANWRDTEVPVIVADKLRHGGIVTFASAAALTLGSHTVPVYEIYKVGEAPRWLDGLDLLAAVGLPVAVIPHYDNAEGGTHDTRFCYLGERRLALLEAMLPADHFVLGVDSHTALVLDIGAGTATVTGVGAVTVRASGRSEVFTAGRTLPIGDLAAAAARLRADRGSSQSSIAEAAVAPEGEEMATGGQVSRTPLDDDVQGLATAFDAQLADGQVEEAVRTALTMDQLLLDWSRDTDGTDDLARARQAFRSLIVRLGQRAGEAGRASTDRRIAPLVDVLVDMRGHARASGDFGQADTIRDALLAAGIELRDGVDGTSWGVRPDA